ncbi:MAG: glycogen/starch/alpha-glucan phosphorylase [Pleomorphochaeta sp.]
MTNTQKTRFGKTSNDIVQDYAEHLKYTLDADIFHNTKEGHYYALALSIMDRIVHQLHQSRETQRKKDAKRVYYLSLEFLMGRAMTNNIVNLGIEKEVKKALAELGKSYEELQSQEPDAGLGNGGLGRLAACFLDSLATLEIPAFGYGIRYNYGIFKQLIKDGWQEEVPDSWLKNGNPWEIPRNDLKFPVRFGGKVDVINSNGKDVFNWNGGEVVTGMAYDMPIVGYGCKTINTLRLWSAKAAEDFNFQEFNEGDYTEAVRAKITAENISQVLYPNDTGYMGKELRLKQQYFFVSCSLQDIIRRFKQKESHKWSDFSKLAAIQLNDTHPSLAVPELMRLLLDRENLSWDEAWEICVDTFGYTNHTLMPEALEKWSLPMLEKLLPRHVQIIFEINHRFLQQAASFFPLKPQMLSKVSIIEESTPKMVRMANLSIIGSHSTNGVAELHSKLLKTNMFPEFNLIFPDRFNNKTNGITQRRWLLDSNPELASLITEAIGDEWILDFSKIKNLAPLATDSAFLDDFAKIKKNCKISAANFLKNDSNIIIDPNTMFDTQVKRIHEYKRQLLNAMNILLIYTKLKNREIKKEDMEPITFLFGGKSAPGYVNAKLIIKFINNLSKTINNDPAVNDVLKVFFMPNYRVSLAEKIIPATNLSEQISTAGTEASGTGNMKFMANGALTIGTLDGANVEMAEEVGKENMFIFGNTEKEIAALAPTYNPYDFILNNDSIKNIVDLVTSGYFNIGEPHIFDQLTKSLLEEGDRYFLFADLDMYNVAHTKARTLYKNNRKEWNQKAILNIAASAKFSSDRTINEYAKDIWNVKPCPVKKAAQKETAVDNAKKF